MPSLQRIVFLSLSFAFAVLSAMVVAAEDDLSSEPYSVFVAVEGAYARCGPGGDYYRTDELRHGQSLEVYAETDDGWLGIRPPEESFCWLVAEAVELDRSGQEGVVIEDKTVAWIGTHLGRARQYRWQVQLAAGEPVSVIGRSEREGPDGPQQWYRIVPPSGEFRWVHRDQVVLSAEELVQTVQTATADQTFLSMGRTGSSDDLPEAVGPVIKREEGDLSGAVDTAASTDAGPSVLQQTGEAIGSGLRQDWQAQAAQATAAAAIEPPVVAADVWAGRPRTLTEAVKQGGLLATVEFLGGPRLADIGAGPTAPSTNAIARDTNWVIGRSRNPADNSTVADGPTATLGNPIQQVSAIGPALTSDNVSHQHSPGGDSLTPAGAPPLKPFQPVSAERIAAVEAETLDADVERLSLILSRLMASQSSAAEAEPVFQAATALATGSSDTVVAGRARLLAERVRQYQRLCRKRDGELSVQQHAPPRVETPSVIPVDHRSGLSDPTSHPLTPAHQATGPELTAAESQSALVGQVGYLVQVYSARPNSPPYALTDHSGRTVVYVTPAPGVNIRTHLNSHVQVVGQQGFLRGLNTPHILATRTSRTPE